jgi:hypothetical protein
LAFGIGQVEENSKTGFGNGSLVVEEDTLLIGGNVMVMHGG